jgi:hypothetical protein
MPRAVSIDTPASSFHLPPSRNPSVGLPLAVCTRGLRLRNESNQRPLMSLARVQSLSWILASSAPEGVDEPSSHEVFVSLQRLKMWAATNTGFSTPAVQRLQAFSTS